MTIMMAENLYIPFGNYILRTPLYPLSGNGRIQPDDAIFDEAIHIASSELYEEKVKEEPVYSKKMMKTMYKYWKRSSTRSTPFGLFAGCAHGTIGEKDINLISPPEKVERHTRLDMNYLCALVQYLETLPELRKKLVYYPNDSLYKVGGRLRYIEYRYEGVRRTHSIEEIDASEHLLHIIDMSAGGSEYDTIVKSLTESAGVTIEEASSFVDELIGSQVLKSELEANLTGEDTLSVLLKTLGGKHGFEKISAALKRLQTAVACLDDRLVYNRKAYEELFRILDSIPVKYDRRYILQTDTVRPAKQATISKETIGNIQDCLDFLAGISMNENPDGHRLHDLEQFEKVFRERYEEEEIPLLNALDPDTGIGYPIGEKIIINNPLIDGLKLPGGRKKHDITILSSWEALIIKKLAGQHDRNEITLAAEDIKWPDMPETGTFVPTISVICEILSDGNTPDRPHIYMKSAGGNTAASLIGRFCYLDSRIEEMAREICRKEQSYYEDDTIVAEIVHLPESRIGNISSRPLLRDMEIHYLARSGMPEDKSIPASDVMISYRGGRLRLRSRRFGKELIPRLTNAHNYTRNSTPAYHFLCDFQTYKCRTLYPVGNGRLLALLGRVPRIKYRNIVLCPQTWKVSVNDFQDCRHADSASRESMINSWRDRTGIPDRIVIADGDNNLCIDFTDGLSREIFCDELWKRKEIIVEEFLYGESMSAITDGEKPYCGEFVIPFFRNDYNDRA